MPVLTGLGSLTSPWRESVVSSSARVHLSECGSAFRPGAAESMDWLGPVSANERPQDCSRIDRLTFADVAFGWADASDLTEDHFNVLVADLALARSVGAVTALGMDPGLATLDHPFVACLAGMADIVRTGSDAASCLAAARSAICDRLYLTLRAERALTPSLAEQSFWRAHRELRIPELRELVPELEVRFPSGSSGQRLVKRYDFAVLSRKILIEVDGSWHDRPDSGRNDRLKDELAESYGWSVMRFRSQHVLAGPSDAVREVAARVARTPLRLDASLDVRTMPTVTADGWTFGHARDDRHRPLGLREPIAPVIVQVNPDRVEDVTLPLVGGAFVDGIEPSPEQTSMLGQIASVFDVDVDKVAAWLAASSVGDRLGPFSWARGNVRRLFFVHHLSRHVPSERAVLGGAVMPKGTIKDPVVIAVNEPFSGRLRSALRHVMHLPEDQIAAVLSAPQGVLTRPVKTLTGPPRLISFVHAPQTDTALAWEVASWWNRTIRAPMRTFTLDVNAAADISAELGSDLLAAYPTLAATVRSWLAGRRETAEAVSKDFPRTRVILRRAEATNTELRDMLARPHAYQPST